uniref:phosphoglucomutase (alpha-D-glucose-1,6-bisphosphate-dependent) n=1 Tax=Trichuris muris TaxID=70415 RepID=A0A5S6QHN2_TRIMR
MEGQQPLKPCVHATKAIAVKTTVYEDQSINAVRPVSEFVKKNYAENLIQCTLDGALGNQKCGAKLIVGGVGHYPAAKILQTIIRVAAANGVSHLMIGKDGVMTTPAVSLAIRQYHADGGIILTSDSRSSVNTGNIGIKFNGYSGGPASKAVIEKVSKCTRQITHFFVCPEVRINLSSLSDHTVQVANVGAMRVEVFDSVVDYGKCMERLFDFWMLRPLFSGSITGTPVRLLVDCMNGASGPYAYGVFHDHLGVFTEDHRRYNPLSNKDASSAILSSTGVEYLLEELKRGVHDVGVTIDYDGTRATVVGSNGFVIPHTDSLAVFAYNVHLFPYFRQCGGVKGLARTVASPANVDRVAKKMKLPCYEVPGDFEHFEALMNAGLVSVCSEEDAGIICNIIREPDGIWAALCWLSVFSRTKRSIEQNVRDVWSTFGRHVFCRCNFEHCSAEAAKRLMGALLETVSSPKFKGKIFKKGDRKFVVSMADNFCYSSPADKTIYADQGIRIYFNDGSHLYFRMDMDSKSQQATVRIAINACIQDGKLHDKPTRELLEPLTELAMEIAKVKEFISQVCPAVSQ